MKALWGLALGNFAVGTGALVVAGVLPEIARDTGVSDAESGLLITVYAVTYALAAPILGSLTGRMDRRLLLVLAALTIAGANAVAAVSTTFDWLLAARVAAALGAAVFTPAAVATATGLVPPERVAGAIALVFGGFVVSSVLGVPIGIWIGGQVGWAGSYWFVAAISTASALTILLVVPGKLKAQGASFRALATVLVNHRLMLALSMSGTQMASQFIPFTFIALLLQRKAGADTDEIALIFLLFGGFSLLGNILGGRASDRYGPSATLLAGMIVLPLVLAGLSLLDMGFAAAVAVLSLWGMAGFSFAAAQQARLVTLAPDQRGAVLSLHGSSLYAGQALGATLGAAILSGYGIDGLGWGGASVALVTLIVFLISLWQWRPCNRVQ
jgi:predicted MFS family arabinose efflux permease